MKVNVFCALGMSTSVIVRKIRIEAQEKNIGIEINAHSVRDIDLYAESSDLILLGPQVSFQQRKIQNKYPHIPVLVMQMRDYGIGDGGSVLEMILENYKKEGKK